MEAQEIVELVWGKEDRVKWRYFGETRNCGWESLDGDSGLHGLASVKCVRYLLHLSSD